MQLAILNNTPRSSYMSHHLILHSVKISTLSLAHILRIQSYFSNITCFNFSCTIVIRLSFLRKYCCFTLYGSDWSIVKQNVGFTMIADSY